MANTENKILQNTLVIDDDIYEVNAVEASRVQASLKITLATTDPNGESNGESNDDIEFNGSEAKEVSIVPASGGVFTGPIKVPDATDLSSIDGKAVVNYGDLSILTTNLRGAGWYKWENNNFEQVTEDNVAKHLGIVRESGENDTIGAFVAYNNEYNRLPVFLYIDRGGDLYLGAHGESSAIKLAQAKQLFDADKKNSYDYNTINNLLTAVQTLNGTSSGHADRLDDLESILDENNSNIVKEATKATNDSDDKEIRTNYYRSASSTNRINSIHITTTSSPVPTNAQIGDIWIKYKA
jgi:hypothetical protein